MMLMSSQSFLKMSSSVNIVFDGNSMVQGSNMTTPSTESLPAQLKLLAPLSNLTTMINVGIGGQDIAAMRTRRAAYVDANYSAGKRNILLVWEGTNSICNTVLTGDQAFDALSAYCSEVLAVHSDWYIVLLTTIPRFAPNTWGVVAANGHLDTYNSRVKSEYKTIGARQVIDVRADGTFAYSGPTVSGVMAPWMDGSIHPNLAGYGLVAQYCATALRRVSARS